MNAGPEPMSGGPQRVPQSAGVVPHGEIGPDGEHEDRERGRPARLSAAAKSQLLVRILLYLIRNRGRQYTAAQLEQYLNGQREGAPSRRSLERYMGDLCTQTGNTVQAFGSRSGRRGTTYGIAPDFLNEVSLPVDRNELLMLFVLKRLQPWFAHDARNAEAIGKALSRLVDNGEESPFEDIDQALAKNSVVMGERQTGATTSATLGAILDALMDHKVLSIVYKANNPSPPTTVDIEPLKLMLYREALYLVGKYPGGPRLYYHKVCRILKATATPREFVADLSALRTIADRAQKNFGMFDDDGAKPAKVAVRFPSWMKMPLRERRYHPTQRITTRTSGDILVQFTAPIGEELARWVMSYAGDAKVLAPKSLKLLVRKHANKVLAEHK